MLKNKILLHQAILIVRDDVYDVEYYREGIELKEGRAYIIGEYVYPYKGRFSNMLCNTPGIYNFNKKVKIIPFPTNNRYKEYRLDKIKELNPNDLMQELVDNPDMIEQSTHINANQYGDRLIPTLKEDDDFLKHLVKKIILKKGVYRSQFKNKFNKPHEFSNLLQSLEKSTKMTVVNFKRWADLLEVNWKIVVSDANGTNKLDDISIGSEDLN